MPVPALQALERDLGPRWRPTVNPDARPLVKLIETLIARGDTPALAVDKPGLHVALGGRAG